MARIKSIIKGVSIKIDEIGIHYVAWDFAMTDDDIGLIEANSRWYHVFLQSIEGIGKKI